MRPCQSTAVNAVNDEHPNERLSPDSCLVLVLLVEQTVTTHRLNNVSCRLRNRHKGVVIAMSAKAIAARLIYRAHYRRPSVTSRNPGRAEERAHRHFWNLCKIFNLKTGSRVSGHKNPGV